MSSLNPKRHRRDRRPEQPRQMRETENDRQVIQLIYQYRILSQQQLERLLNKSRSRVQQIMMRLYHHEYVERLFLPVFITEGRSPTLYILGKRGVAVLRRLGIEDMSGQPSKNLTPMFLEHTLAINDVRIAIAQACEQHDWSILTWKGENDLKAAYDRVILPTKSGKSQSVSVIPDSYFIVYLPGRGVYNFFMELDRGSMTLDRFRNKMMAYVAYYKSGKYEQRFRYKGFRVLTVVDTVSPQRVENLVKQTETVPAIGNRFWFAHLPALAADNILTQPVWHKAGSPEKQALIATHE